jgi:hypothetical protein
MAAAAILDFVKLDFCHFTLVELRVARVLSKFNSDRSDGSKLLSFYPFGHWIWDVLVKGKLPLLGLGKGRPYAKTHRLSHQLRWSHAQSRLGAKIKL